MCTLYTMQQDGHDYTLRVDATNQTTSVYNSDDELVGTIETSPCGEYMIATSADNPLGMSSHHHIHSTTMEDLAGSVIAESY